jgi:guanosine-3',5'-bis(diphosphate) 3'-pyrophosphohydrolase
MQTVIKAYEFASQKHKDQRRKDPSKSPYINHPIQVASLLSQAGVTDPEIICAGILHDTVEDTKTTYEELVREFGQNITSMVMECTDDKSLPKVTRKQHQIAHARVISYGAKLVKLADKYANLSDIQTNPPAHWSKGEIEGYVVWAFVVCRGLEKTNAFLESRLMEIFKSYQIDQLSNDEIYKKLNEYYASIADKD